MKKNLLFLLVVITIASNCVFASSWQNIQSAQVTPANIELVSSDLNLTTIHYSLAGFNLNDITTSRGKESIVDVPSGYPLYIEGAPDLKRISTSLIIPDYGSTLVKVVASSYKDYSNVSVAPSKGIIYPNDADKPFVYGDVYSKNEFYPGTIAEGRDPHIMRNIRGQVIDVYPFQYNPVTKTLRVYYDFTVEVKTNTAESGINSLFPTAANTDAFEQLYESMYLNHAAYQTTQFSSKTPMDNPNGRMLVICYDDYEPAMTPFVEWKTLKGIKTELVKVKSIGSTSATLKTYVDNYYKKFPDFTYLVLVGDHAQVPSNIISNYGSDAKYAQITGSDVYPEIICGRISATQLSHVTSQVTKFITYEKTPNQLDVKGFSTAVTMSVKVSPDASEKDVTRFMRYIKTTLSPVGYSFTQLFEDGSGDMTPSKTNISNAINKNPGFVSWISHGTPTALASFSYSNTDVNALKNTKMWPMIWNCSCQSGNFTSNTCFGETWLRAVSNNVPIGAIGCAMSTRDMPVGPSEEYGNAAAKLLVDKARKNQTYGAITYDTYLKVAVQNHKMNIEFNCMIIFGDPSLQVRTAVPQALTLTHHTTDAPGITSLVVTSAVEGAYVALTLNGQIIGTGYITGGTATINFPPVANNNQIMVTGTAFNYEPYMGKDVIGTLSSISDAIGNIVSFQTYPNPASAALNVSFNVVNKADYNIQIKNALGQAVYQDMQSDFVGNYNKQIDVSSFGKGVYFISVSSLGEEMFHKVVVY